MNKKALAAAIEIPCTMSGHFSLDAVTLDAAGNEISRRHLADFENIITNGGLDRMGANSDWMTACQVGTGSAAPAATDTALSTYLAGTSTQQSISAACQSSSPYYFQLQKTFRFAAGTATGNLTEVGIAWTTTTGNLYSRALILDGAGAATTISVLASEALDVTYTWRVYPPTTDVTGSITISGTTYNYTLRACVVTTLRTGGAGWGFPGSNPFLGISAAMVSTLAAHGANASTIGTITSGPTGTSYPPTSVTAAAYGALNLYRDGTLQWALTEGNTGSGVKSVVFTFPWCSYQIEFSTALPKDATKVLTLTFRHSWARHP